jgi:hypothetical protein
MSRRLGADASAEEEEEEGLLEPPEAVRSRVPTVSRQTLIYIGCCAALAIQNSS